MSAARLHRQHGFALIVSLLIVAMVASMALLFTSRQQLWTRQLENRKGFTTASTIAFAAIDMTRLTLRDDARNSKVDHLLEPWTIPIPPIAVEEGRIAGVLREQQGRFNLSNLLPGTDGKLNDIAVQRVSRALGLNQADLSKLLRAYAALRLREPGATPELSELIRLAQISPNSAQTLLQSGVVLPEATPVNVNFANAEVLQASLADLSPGDAGALIAQRTRKPFMSLNEFKAALPAHVQASVSTQTVDVQSTYFIVRVDAWFNDVHLAYDGLLKRNGVNLPQLIWVRRSPLADS